MASSSDTANAVRGFVPPQNDDERRLMRRVEELCRGAVSRGIPRYTGFLSDREQSLAQAACNKAGCNCIRFWGGRYRMPNMFGNTRWICRLHRGLPVMKSMRRFCSLLPVIWRWPLRLHASR